MVKFLVALKALAPYLKPAIKLLILWWTKRAGRKEEQARNAKLEAKRQRRYAKIASERRTADDAADRMRDGKF